MSVTQTEPDSAGAVPVRFQQFLNRKGFGCGREDGRAGPKTERATRAFQKRHRLPATGRLDPATEEKALEIDPSLKAARFDIGPDKADDIRLHRPYFAVQLERNDRPLPYIQGKTENGGGVGWEPSKLRPPQSRCPEPKSPREGPESSGIDPAPPGREADCLCDRIVNYVDAARDQPGPLLLTKEQMKNPDRLWEYLRDSWRRADAGEAVTDRPGVLLLRRLTDTTVVHALENSPAPSAALLTQALNGAIEHQQLFFDNDPAADVGLSARIAAQIEGSRAVRMGVATVLAKQQGGDFPERLAQERGRGAAALSEDLLRCLSRPEVTQLSSRLRVFVNRLLVGIAFADYLPAIGARGPVTDIYLLSHGWHRNYYQATSAYDRLVSRFSRLLDRRVLETPEPFHPLILAAHWHSDPGEDGWVDPAGRRDKRSFLQNVEMLFERPRAGDEADVPREERFTRVFEQCFEFFGRTSAADVHAISGTDLDAKAQELAEKLDRFTLRDDATALEHNKVAAVWTCYHEAQPKRALTDQEMAPARSLTPVQAVKNLWRFLLGAVGIFVLLGLLVKLPLVVSAKDHASDALDGLHDRLSAAWLPGAAQAGLHPALGALRSGLIWVVVGLGLLALAAGVGALFLAWQAQPGGRKRLRGVPFWVVAAWAPVEILLFLPALTLLLFTYFFSRRNKTDPGSIFSERTGRRNEEITPEQRQAARDGLNFPNRGSRAPARRWAAWLAMQPIALYKQTLDPKNPNRDLFAGFENLLSFYEMQVRGTVAGGTAGQFLSRIVTDMTDGGLCASQVRVHLVGHSFGGLVVLNAARHAALDPRCRRPDGEKLKIHSLTLLQAAVNSNWAERETAMLENMTGPLGCAFSAYDTANAFYFPIANGGRLAAGYVGLFGAPGPGGPRPALRIPRLEGNDFTKFDTVSADLGLLAMLVEPPPLAAIVGAPLAADRQVLNLDMSRIVYEGPVPLGGGHTDIHKDDVINLIWAVTRLDRRPGANPLAPSPPSGGHGPNGTARNGPGGGRAAESGEWMTRSPAEHQ